MTMRKAKVRVIPAAEFKAKCLALLDKVAMHHETLVVTKHGRPVARVVPMRELAAEAMLGSVLAEDDIVSPLGEDWDADR